MRYRLYAAKQIVEEHGPIDTPHDAARVPWVLGHTGPSPSVWGFRDNRGGRTEIEVKARLTTSNIVARMDAAALGMGVVGLPDFMQAAAGALGLVRLLADFAVEPEIPIYAVYPGGRLVSPRVAALLEHLQAAGDQPRSPGT